MRRWPWGIRGKTGRGQRAGRSRCRDECREVVSHCQPVLDTVIFAEAQLPVVDDDGRNGPV